MPQSTEQAVEREHLRAVHAFGVFAPGLQPELAERLDAFLEARPLAAHQRKRDLVAGLVIRGHADAAEPEAVEFPQQGFEGVRVAGLEKVEDLPVNGLGQRTRIRGPARFVDVLEAERNTLLEYVG